jgi:hypothetical protein
MKNTESTCLRKKQSAIKIAMLCLALAFAVFGCRQTGGQNNLPTVPPTNPPVQQPQSAPPTDTVQPTSVPAVPTATVAQPTTAPTATATVQPIATSTAAANTDAEGDQIERLLNQLNQMNQNGDPFGDLPQP